jgi:hypothetical protein
MKICVELKSKPIAVIFTFVVISIATLFFQCYGCSRKVSNFRKIDYRYTKANAIAECRVSFIINDQGPFAEVCIKEESQIDNLILLPLQRAKQDTNPACYQILGTLTIIGKDGTCDSILLFQPWGYYQHNDEYFVADLNELQLACRKTLQETDILYKNDAGVKGNVTDVDKMNKPDKP